MNRKFCVIAPTLRMSSDIPRRWCETKEMAECHARELLSRDPSSAGK